MIDEYPTFLDLMLANRGDRIAAENHIFERVYHGTELNSEE